jgi:hypothetical protein
MVGGRGRGRSSAVSPVWMRDRVGRAVPGQIPPNTITKPDPIPWLSPLIRFSTLVDWRARTSPLLIPARPCQPTLNRLASPAPELDPLSLRPKLLDPVPVRPKLPPFNSWPSPVPTPSAYSWCVGGVGAARARTPHAHAE